jgi:DNA invertase Pin-like site-specific DNA recombinase
LRSRLIEEFYDAAVSGADPIDARPGFKALLERIMSNGVRTVIVEDASRFARTLMVQEAGIATLAGLGVRVITSRGDDLTESDDEMRVAMRQIVGRRHGQAAEAGKSRHRQALELSQDRQEARRSRLFQ